jgi:DNA-binding transcriptional LysR family regulator
MRLHHPHSPPLRHRRPRITLDQLHTFLAVADAEHVTAAATALGLSQGSVSAAVSRLEDTLGLPLLQRVGRNVRLTDVGRAVRQIGTQVFDHIAMIEELAAGYLAFERGEVTIAAGRVVGAHQLPVWLAPFVSEHSEIDVRIRLAPLHAVLGMLRDGSADVVVVSADVKPAGLETLVLDRTELVIVVGAHHPLAASRTPMRELHAHRYLAHESGTGTRMHAEQLLGREIDGLATIELEEGALHAALLAGIGFGVVARSIVEPEIESRRLVVLKHPGRPVRQRVTAARRLALHPPAVTAFWQHLEGIARGVA